MAETVYPGSVTIATWEGASTIRTTAPILRLDERAYKLSRDTSNYS